MLIKFQFKKEKDLKTHIDNLKKYSRLSATCEDAYMKEVYEVIFFIFVLNLIRTIFS